MWSRNFWAATAERAVKAFAATLASVFFVGGAALDIRGIDWGNALGVAGGAALASLVFSIGGSQLGPKGSPSLVADPAAAGAEQGHLDREALVVQQQENLERLKPEFGRSWTTGGYHGGDPPPPPT